MIKKFIYYGIAAVIIAIIIVIVSGSVLKGGISKNVSTYNISVGADNFTYLPITLRNTSAVAVYAIMVNSTNLYILNSSTFTNWNNYVSLRSNASGLAEVQSLNVNTSYVFSNKTGFIIVPVLLSGNAFRNGSGDSLFVVVDNTPGSKSSSIATNVIISYLPLQSNSLVAYEALDIIAFIVGAAGIILVVYGFVKKSGPKIGALDAKGEAANQKDKEYVDKLYEGVGKKGSKKRNRRPSSSK